MRATFEFTDEQAGLFKDVLDTSLRAAVWQEMKVKDAIELNEALTEVEKENLWAYLKRVTAQRTLLAEVLGTFLDKDEQTSIITNVSDSDLLKLKRGKKK